MLEEAGFATLRAVDNEPVLELADRKQMSGQYPILTDDYESIKRTKPSEFVKHYTGGRFLIRQRNGSTEVYGYGLEHLCWARDYDTAKMIADALELAAAATTDDKLPKLSDLVGLTKDSPIDVAAGWEDADEAAPMAESNEVKNGE